MFGEGRQLGWGKLGRLKKSARVTTALLLTLSFISVIGIDRAVNKDGEGGEVREVGEVKIFVSKSKGSRVFRSLRYTGDLKIAGEPGTPGTV